MKSSKFVLAVAATTALLLSACTNQSGGDDGKSDKAAGDTKGGGDATYALVVHSAPGDPFWDVVKSGAEQAAEDLGVTVTFNGDPDPTKQSQLIDNAVAQGVDGLVVSMANPDGVRSSVEAAVGEDIPVITINSGLEQSKEFGAITHVGQSEALAGEAAGEQLAELGGKKMICVIHEAGNVGLEDRCAGAAKTFGGEAENLQVDVSNIADAQSTIRSKLSADSSVDTMLILNNAVAMAAAQAQQEAGTDAQIGTFDLSSDVLGAIEDDAIAFAVDQQPYAQGYLPVVFLALKDRNGNDIGGGQPVYSGPAFVTKDNAAQVEEFAANGTR
ncbi:MAG: substrate-binding domain-containing protein [Nocardioidaceae bacterium]